MSERFAVCGDIQLFQRSVEACFAALRERPVEFVVLTGDVMDVLCREPTCPVRPIPEGGDVHSSWRWTVDLLNSIQRPWFATPGNHDLYTSTSDPFGAADTEALGMWQSYAGPTQFVTDSQFCRIVGINYADWTAGNQTWLAGQIDTTSKWRIMVQHYPITGGSAGWLDTNAASKLSFCAAHDVRLFLCGHHHACGQILSGTTRHVICPAMSYLIPPTAAEPVSRDLVGWLEVVATATNLTVEVWRPSGKIYEFSV